jgi:hypothetical protein
MVNGQERARLRGREPGGQEAFEMVVAAYPRRVRQRARRIEPRHPSFVELVLRPLAQRARAGEDRACLVDELFEGTVHPWAESYAARQAVGLPSHADRNEVHSQVLRLAWEACRRIDWDRIESWPALLEAKVAHARTEAARSDDWLSRRERVHRRRFLHAIESREQSCGRPLSSSEKMEVALTVVPSSNRVDWAAELLVAKHPSTVAEPPDVEHHVDVAEEVAEVLRRRERAACLKEWLALVAYEDARLADDLQAWHDNRAERGRPLPARLARRVEPYISLLLCLLGED